MNKKAESSSVIILWMGIILAVLIVVFWTTGKINPHHYFFQKSASDLDALQGRIDQSCISHYYKAKYNPHTEDGFIIFNDNSMCINSSEYEVCRNLLCKTGLNITIDLENITEIIIIKNETLNRTIIEVSE